MTELLAYTPFLEPCNWLQSWWYLLLIPLAFGLSIIYKAMRMGDLGRFWPQVAMMTTQIVVAMIALAIVLALLIVVVIPLLPAEAPG